MRPDKPAGTVRRAKRLRQKISLPEVLLWRELKGSNLHFRKQHEAGDYVLDFFCARANLVVEIDGFSHNTGDRPERDEKRTAWLKEYRIDTVRISASDVLRDPAAVAQSVVTLTLARLESFGKTPPSALRAATSPSQVDGEDLVS